VFLAVCGYVVGWGEYGKEVRVQFLCGRGGETAHAGERGSFLVDLTVAPDGVRRLEDGQEVVGHLLVIQPLEAACATRCQHDPFSFFLISGYEITARVTLPQNGSGGK
jgi:hypothetical protein